MWLKRPPFSRTHVCTQSNSLLSKGSLDDSVVKAMPLFDKTLLKVVGTVDRDTVDWSRDTLRTSSSRPDSVLIF